MNADTALLKTVRRCSQWLEGHCCSIADGTVRPYLVGHRCSQHTPSAVTRRSEPQPDPTRTITGLRDARRNTDVVIDMPGVGRVVIQ